MSKKSLQELVIDFKNYAFVLLATSVFLYIGVILPDQGKEGIYDIILMLTTSLFLIGSFVCFKCSLKYKKQIDEQEENAS
ncbi:YrhC family protein [Metabacillus litoralis]|uniref:YrhC family protein n=1 Tax=Metabacillus litoralis TaxID=152268 RepID=UPI001CFE41BC|nr:YrhC family protein [Metabacillus litoralis]